MIDHITICVTSFAKAQIFYDAALAPISASCLAIIPESQTDGVKIGGYGTDLPTFWIVEGAAQTPPVHIAFAATTRAQVDAFHAVALTAGGADNGAPGLRPHYHEYYYAAFVRDPDGNNIELVCHSAATR